MEERKLNSITIHEAKTEDGIRRIRVERLTEQMRLQIKE